MTTPTGSRWLDTVTETSWKRLGEERLNRPTRWRSWLLLAVLGSAAAGFVLMSWPGLLVGVLLTPAVLRGAVLVSAARYRRACTEALPDALTLMAASLGAGHSLGQSIGSAVRAGGPLAGELGRVEAMIRLGESVPDALAAAAERLRSKDLTWVVIAVRINSRIGGDLGQLLRTIAGTLRERETLRRTARVLAAEGRLSAWVLAALPIGFVALLLVLRPEHLQPLVADQRGWMLIGAAILLFALGSLWLRRAIRLEV